MGTSSLSLQAPLTAQRDLRVDFFRGLALLMVLVDHIEYMARERVVSHWTLIALGFSDAAELFVFLSGFAFGLSYTRRLAREGLWACQKKAIYRAIQIYFMYLLALASVVFLAYLGIAQLPDRAIHFPNAAAVTSLAGQALTLRLQPNGFTILSFYILALPFMPCVLWLLHTKSLVAWAICGGLYLAVQLEPTLTIARLPGFDQWFFNPLAWQFLFFLAMVAATWDVNRLHPRMKTMLLSMSIVVAIVGLLSMKIIPWWQGTGELPAFLDRLAHLPAPAEGKANLSPLRLVHSLALLVIVTRLFPKDLRFWTSSWSNPLVRCGQHSLVLYSFGLVLSFAAAGMLLYQIELRRMYVLLADLYSCFVTIGLAYALAPWSFNRRTQRAGEARKKERNDGQSHFTADQDSSGRPAAEVD